MFKVALVSIRNSVYIFLPLLSCLLVLHCQLVDGSGLKEILETCSLATIGVSAVVGVNQIKRALYCV